METKEKQTNDFDKDLKEIAQSIIDINVKVYELIDKYRAINLLSVANNLEQCTKELKENKIFSMPAPF